MSTEREPLLSDEQIATKCNFMCYPHESIAKRLCTSLRDIYEAARAKDAELIQGLLDLGFHDSDCKIHALGKCDCNYGVAIKRAAAAGFKPTEL